ncbi:leucyl aminopeptidase [Pseudoalteromonas shioyasakiensis]|uniref:Probable cytosol aminopeptidase n=1 Tax=Pseudoalteromonas shioyasakiensis TaxID=1190813 RepID=A0ABT6TVS4_9GAMM|nr:MULTISPECIES: leucyl aminopeptidase [Pseudoalteromonas]MDI4668008.1 leucyl aminopeptidase [Pseudoalteromonas shioyasakiensis]MDI4672762.1 leucyl aminopeptidase [Pseudoalteromonas shioyasakiensis]MDI4684826.1 leucyl aminopeptidase [Pseudoalteromonas shioyasakiensis]MDI4703210.1 leucyl aminopeptidase [Pseudoalteromonas shioyasakiensis]NUJ20163.1 leucyl aminopeptidase [Pseudoalteromonas sp. 0802]
MKIAHSLSAIALGLTLATQVNAAEFTFAKSIKPNDNTLVLFLDTDSQVANFNYLKPETQTHLNKVIEFSDFKAGYGKTLEVIAPNGSDHQRILLVGLGEQPKLDAAKMAKLGGNVHAKLQSAKQANVSLDFSELKDSAINAKYAAEFAHGANLRDHRFEQYKKEQDSHVVNYTLDVENLDQAAKTHKLLQSIEQGVFLARDLTSEVATEMTPVDFAKAAKELKKLGVKITVLEPKQLKKLGMGALEAVGRGSEEGARLVVAHYQGNKNTPIALVGKGITFDSGGYSLKTGASIARMKSDMAGAAAVLGTVKAMALAKADTNVVAVMGMAANMVSQFAVAPGDVVRTAEGLSVEIVNTDAEGRLVLSDAMWYARDKYKPSIMVDVATLTGSKIRAVGNDYAAVFSDDDTLVEQLTIAGKQVNENLWRLPLGYEDALKSDIADLKNIGSHGPGATTAASFLQNFAGDTRWVHIDIAGNALNSKAKDELAEGGTGYGVRLLSNWLLNNAQ